MARLSVCKKCQKQLQPNEKFTFSNKSYCENCYNILKRESDDYKNLISYICDIFEINSPTGLILKQIKEYKNELKYNYTAMWYTLWYCKEILDKDFDIQFGVALIKYHYNDAENYYLQQDKISKSLNNAEIKTKVIKIKCNNEKTNCSNSKPLIDIKKIIKECIEN